MWMLRKFYAGNGGALPPTDPRILSMTPTQVDLEFHHMMLDRHEKGENVYQDDGYDDYEKESDEIDSQLSDMPTFGDAASDPHAGQVVATVDTNNEDGDWDEVDIDDD